LAQNGGSGIYGTRGFPKFARAMLPKLLLVYSVERKTSRHWKSFLSLQFFWVFPSLNDLAMEFICKFEHWLWLFWKRLVERKKRWPRTNDVIYWAAGMLLFLVFRQSFGLITYIQRLFIPLMPSLDILPFLEDLCIQKGQSHFFLLLLIIFSAVKYSLLKKSFFNLQTVDLILLQLLQQWLQSLRHGPHFPPDKSSSFPTLYRKIIQ
jgi:hypothetical protein